MPIRGIIAAVLLLPSFLIAQNSAQRGTWEPLRYFDGSWEGTGNGQPGLAKTQREYKFVLNGKFLHVQNRSVYEPQAKNQTTRKVSNGGLHTSKFVCAGCKFLVAPVDERRRLPLR